MMDEKRLEQEYRRLKHQQAPDLWARIEGNLQEHPERNPQVTADVGKLPEESRKLVRLPRHRIYGMATAAAAMLVLMVAAPRLMEKNGKGFRDQMTAPTMAGAAETTVEEEEDIAGAVVPEAVPEFGEAAEESAAPGGGMPEEKAGREAEKTGEYGESAGAASGAMPENGTAGAASGVMPENGAVGAAPGAMPGTGTDRSAALSPVQGIPEQYEGKGFLRDGVLTCDQLQLAAYQPVVVPENAVTVSEDMQYFSEDILRDAELLCGGTVTEVSLEQDASGKAVKVVYEMTLDQVYFAEDYVTGIETITVKSPIVRTDGDEMYIMYQLQPGGTYLLPLHKPEQDWELLYPFAPQIQETGDGAYLFHSGYASLMNEDTSVVIGRPEGDSDYFYDRMVLRRDENFLSDLLRLVEH